MVDDWLMDADPAIRWQVMQDLLDEPADFELEPLGEPSRWNTLRALRVLDWYGSAHEPDPAP